MEQPSEEQERDDTEPQIDVKLPRGPADAVVTDRMSYNGVVSVEDMQRHEHDQHGHLQTQRQSSYLKHGFETSFPQSVYSYP